MNNLAAWIVENGQAKKVLVSSFNYEKDLEIILEKDPSLISPDFKIIGRQVKISSGYIDLLGLDQQGQFTVVEIKKGLLSRDAIAQAIDYASEISQLSFKELKEKADQYLNLQQNKTSVQEILTSLKAREDDENCEREVKIIIIGVGMIESVERMINYLTSKSGLNIEAIGFNVFEVDDKILLIREFEETISKQVLSISTDSLKESAKKYKTDEILDEVISFSKQNNLKIRPYKNSIMVAPPQHGNRCLFTVWIEPFQHQLLQVYVAVEAFEQFMAISAVEFTERIGKKAFEKFSREELKSFLENLGNLLQEKMKN